MQRGPIGPLCMSAAKIVRQLTGGNFASVWINNLDGGLVNSSCGSGVLVRDISSERHQVIDCLRRPEDAHGAARLGAERSFVRPHEFTHSLTCSYAIPSPRSNEATAL